MKKQKKIILFGAGEVGLAALEVYGNAVVYFADNDPSKQGKVIAGREVLSPTEMKQLLQREKLYQVVITSGSYQEEIAAQLKALGVKCFFHYLKLKPLHRIREEINRYCTESVYLYTSDPEYAELILSLCFPEGIEVKKWEYSEDGVAEGKKSPVLVLCKDSATECIRIAAKYEGKVLSLCNTIRAFYDTDCFLIENQTPPRTEEDMREEIRQFRGEYIRILNQCADAKATYGCGKPVNISIETINRCNGSCSFCPASAHNDRRRRELMEQTLFEKLMDELEEWEYDGELALYANNEPFLDSRLPELAAYARARVPQSCIRVLTNGTLLSLELLERILPSVDILFIENYSDNNQMHETVRRIYEYCMDHPEKQKKIAIWMRNQTEILSSRGGLAPNRTQIDDYGDCRCGQPFESMYIHPNGDCSICCADVFGEIILGNAAEQSLRDIWNGKRYQTVRTELSGGRKNIEKCRSCDQFIAYNI